MNTNQHLIMVPRNFHLLLLLPLLLFTAIHISAKSKKIPNCLKSIVVFSKTSDETNRRFVTGTGFIISYNGKLVVATNLNIIYHNLKPAIKTIDGNKLKYSKILIPKDKRNIILFELDPKTPEEYYKKLELDLDVAEDTNIKDKVLTFGCKSNWETITSAKGKISGLGPVNIEIESIVPYNMNGGPIISYSTGKVIGVLSKLSSYYNVKKYKSKSCKGIRIDSIKEMIPLNEEDFFADQKKLKKKESVLLNIKNRYEKYLSAIDKLSEKIESGLGTKQSSINKLEKLYETDLRKLNSIVAQMDNKTIYSMKYFQSRHRHAVSSAKAMIDKFMNLEKLFEKLKKENEKAAIKNNMKGLDLKRNFN